MADATLIFDNDLSREDARVWLLPIPFDATTSYRPGTVRGPEAILAASGQLELIDPIFGDAAQRIWMEPIEQVLADLSARCRSLAEPIVAQGAAAQGDAESLAEINRAGETIRARTREHMLMTMDAGRLPGLVGGEHSVSLGAIEACAERHPGLGVLQIDAHMDLRDAYQGMAHSHASVMRNALERCPGLARLVQVGIRDFGVDEIEYARTDPRVATMFDHAIAEQLAGGRPMLSIIDEAIAALPERVYITVDIDGLDPSLCPSTGTPVPGGLSFQHLSLLLDRLARTGRVIVGFDVVEVAPGPGPLGSCIDSIMGARTLLRVCGAALRSQGMLG